MKLRFYKGKHLKDIKLSKIIGLNMSYFSLALIDSIHNIGLQNPITVLKRGKNYVLLDGHSRAVAVSYLGYPTIKAFVQQSNTPDEIIEVSIPVQHGLCDGQTRLLALLTVVNKWTKKYPNGRVVWSNS